MESGIFKRDCGKCGRRMTLDVYRGVISVHDDNILHKYKALSQWGVHEDGSINSSLEYMFDYDDCPLCNGEVDIMQQFKQDIKPVMMKLKRIWRAINEFKEFVETNKLRDSKKTLTSLVYMLSDFEVSLATDYQELYKGLDKDFVFNTICKCL